MAKRTRKRRTPHEAVHLQYVVDLRDPTEAKLERIKSELVRRITRAVDQEQKSLGELEPETVSRHDRHWNFYSGDSG